MARHARSVRTDTIKAADDARHARERTLRLLAVVALGALPPLAESRPIETEPLPRPEGSDRPAYALLSMDFEETFIFRTRTASSNGLFAGYHVINDLWTPGVTDGLGFQELFRGPYSGDLFITQFNAAGVVIGGFESAVPVAGYWRSDGVFVEVASPIVDLELYPADINDANVMVGTLIDPLSREAVLGVRYEDGVFTTLPNLYNDPDARSAASDINNADLMVGQCFDVGDRYGVPVVWREGEVAELTTPVGGIQGIDGINDSGVIVGSARKLPPESGRIPLVWDPGSSQARVLPGPHANQPGWDVWTRGITEDGRVLGAEANYDIATFRYIVWPDIHSDPVGLDLLVPPKADWEPWSFVPQNPRIHGMSPGGHIMGEAERPGRIGTEAFLMAPVTPTLEMDALAPGQAGVLNTITVRDAQPNDDITIVVGRYGGGRLIPGCRIADNLLQIDRPTVIATGVADATGTAVVEVQLPPGFADRTLLFQALVGESCAISNLVVQRLE